MRYGERWIEEDVRSVPDDKRGAQIFIREFGWPHRTGPITVRNYKALAKMARACPDFKSDQEKAELVMQCRGLIAAARAASQSGSDRLKPISDSARHLIGEIPAVIPRNGFKTEEDVDFRDSLTADEIEQRLKDELQSWQLLDWLELAETAAL